MSETHSPDTDEAPQVISDTQAKQGRRGLHILVVLVASASLAALALFLLWMARAGDLASVEQHNARQFSDVAGVDQPVGSARQGAGPDEGG